MKALSITLDGFRNFTSARAEFAETVNILYGSNGSGKTNLLEAIFVLCLGRSQRRASDAAMLCTNSDVYRVSGRIEADGSTQEVAVAYERSRRKRLTISGAVAGLSQLYEKNCAVSAGPEDSEILFGPPAVRRGFLDIYNAQLSLKYLSELSSYQRALAQKNAALRQGLDGGPFEPLLIRHGARVMLTRTEFLQEVDKLAAAKYARVSHGEPISLTYRPSVKIDAAHSSVEEIETAFQVSLEDQLERERVMQTALAGPHRDDIMIEIGGLPARTHSSRGQWRTAALCLKLAVYDLLREKRQTAPLLLLDEVFAELDKTRSDSLIEMFADYSQMFLTTAAGPPEQLRASSKSFHIQDGNIREGE
ncbi:MAG: DNA replication/repair protein RecF [Candidatus Zixiibacteriota bacterium]|nr:MAG: DNA replication/repair protein RecF [candidate division Zixibacteria bacterium]